MKTIAVIQARMGSTRLPGKVLMDLLGEPMLARVVNRVIRSNTIDEVVVATTDNPSDDAIENLCKVRGWLYYRGSEEDVLDRYYQAVKINKAEIVVRITADCPLIAPEVMDQVIHVFLRNQPGVDFASNTIEERTFPRGLDTEVMTFKALKQAWSDDDNPAWREHVTPYIRRHPDLFKSIAVFHDENLSYMRWTVDTPEDLNFMRKIYGEFHNDQFSWQEVLSLLQLHPDWLAINRDVKQKKVQ